MAATSRRRLPTSSSRALRSSTDTHALREAAPAEVVARTRSRCSVSSMDVSDDRSAETSCSSRTRRPRSAASSPDNPPLLPADAGRRTSPANMGGDAELGVATAGRVVVGVPRLAGRGMRDGVVRRGDDAARPRLAASVTVDSPAATGVPAAAAASGAPCGVGSKPIAASAAPAVASKTAS